MKSTLGRLGAEKQHAGEKRKKNKLELLDAKLSAKSTTASKESAKVGRLSNRKIRGEDLHACTTSSNAIDDNGNSKPVQRFHSTGADSNVVNDLLTQWVGDTPAGKKAIQTKLENKVILIENQSRTVDWSKQRRETAEKLAKSRKGRLSMRARRQLGWHKVKSANVTWEQMGPLRTLWQQYFHEAVIDGPPSHDQLLMRTLKADFHGATLEVESSRTPQLVGMTGTVITETEQTFQIVDANDKIKILIKKGSTFLVRHPNATIRLYGTQLCVRPAERANKRFRPKDTVDL